jgi:hypothetical protein
MARPTRESPWSNTGFLTDLRGVSLGRLSDVIKSIRGWTIRAALGWLATVNQSLDSAVFWCVMRSMILHLPRFLLGILLSLASCTAEEERPLAHAPSPASPDLSQPGPVLSLAPPPEEVIAACKRVKAVVNACPGRIPLSGSAEFRFQGFSSGPYATFTAEAGSGPYEDPEKNSPPGFVHFAAQGGDLSDAFETFSYSTAKSFEPEDGLMLSEERLRQARLGRAGKTPQGLFLGTVMWNDLTGELVLVPSFIFVDSIHADHAIFVWQARGHDYALSVHAWEPFTESVATLEAMVLSLPNESP